MTLRTLHDRTLIERDETKKKVGSLHIPDTAQEPPNRGKVLSVGSRVRDLKVGDRVCFIKTAGAEVKVDDKPLLHMREMDVYGVIEADGMLRPIGSKVLIKPDPPEEKVGRIVIPKSIQKDRQAREQLISGKLMAMGLGMPTKSGGRWPMPDVKIGQRVLYFQNFTAELTFNGETYVVVADDQLRAVVEEEQPTANVEEKAGPGEIQYSAP